MYRILHKLRIQLFIWLIAHVMWCNITPTKCNYKIVQITQTKLKILNSIIVYVICDPSGRNQSHVGRVRFPLRAEMHGRAHITDSCFIAFIASKIC